MNDAVVIKENNALVLDTTGEALSEEVSVYEQKADAIVIVSNADLEHADEYLANIVRLKKQVSSYWEALVKPAYKSWRNLKDAENEMLNPLKIAEETVKAKMADYNDRVRAAMERKNAAIKADAQKEVDRKLEEAIAMEEAGDDAGAAYAMVEAETASEIADNGSLVFQKPKAKHSSFTKTWVIESIDESMVPVDINGAVIRPVDEKAVMALIKATKGKIAIPGIKYKETVTVSVRS